jgi:hypothetical protein
VDLGRLDGRLLKYGFEHLTMRKAAEWGGQYQSAPIAHGTMGGQALKMEVYRVEGRGQFNASRQSA